MDILPHLESMKRRLAAKSVADERGCRRWTGSSANGYGVIKMGGRNTPQIGAHVASWMVAHHRMPPRGMHVCHACDVPLCINPTHLFLGTRQDNMDDMWAKGRGSSGAAHSAAIKAGWTPEVRARMGEVHRARWARQRAEAAAEAGVPVDWKRCPKCETWKPRSDYHRNGARDDGLKPYCKACVKPTVTLSELEDHSTWDPGTQNRLLVC